MVGRKMSGGHLSTTMGRKMSGGHSSTSIARKMSGGHPSASIAVSAALAALLLLAACGRPVADHPKDQAKPQLFLLTALPIVWGESFGLDQQGSPVLAALERDYRVTIIDLPSQVPDGGLLLAAQPRALPAEELVALDAWVRRGGRLLLLADPLLEWPSELPVGDPRRPPVAFADTGLLRHWGLGLDTPEERGPRQLSLGSKPLLVASPGTLQPGGGGECGVGANGLIARCRLGEGRAVIVADADFLHLGPGGLDGPTDGNLPALVSQLADLSR